MSEEVLLCPFCGAPQGEKIATGVIQVKCNYCGAMVVVPPSLGGIVQRCPNHPEKLALGLCNDCGKSFCDACLYIWEVDHGRLNICSKCYDSRNSMKSVVATFTLVISAILFIVFLVVIFQPVSPGSGSPFQVLFGGIIFLIASVVTLTAKKKLVSVHDFLAQTAHTLRAFMKKCIKCGQDIPIASEQCQYCGAVQPEYAG